MGKKLTHNEFVDKLKIQNKHYANKEFYVIDKYINSTTKLRCMCHLGHVWPVKPQHLLHSNCGCPYCSGNTILQGFNDMWTTKPDIAQLLKNPDDGYKFGQYSNQKVEFVCPKCNCIMIKSIDSVSRQGFSCSMCSDGVSYPNKFSRAFLKQLPIENLDCEYQPEWAKPYFYDNYFVYKNQAYILEMDGAFHFEEKSCSDLSLNEVLTIDKIKTEMATAHNIVVIRIDCRISQFDYIKQSILQSDLSQIFDLTFVDWNMCDKISCNSLVKEACDLYMSGIHSTESIGQTLCVSSKTIVDYLKRGARVGWCSYNPKNSRKFAKKPIAVIDSDDNIMHTFDSAKICTSELSRLYNVYVRYDCLIRACENNRTYKGFNFKYINNT